MNFIEKTHSQYLVVSAKGNLANKILKLASDILALNYDETTEKKLLAVLEKAYEDVQGTKVTADVKWDKIMRENKEKQKRRKEQMAAENERVKSDMKSGKLKHYHDAEYTHPVNKGKEVKREIAKEVTQLGTVISVDFSKKKTDHEVRLPQPEAEHIERVRKSLEKINELMAEMKSQSK